MDRSGVIGASGSTSGDSSTIIHAPTGAEIRHEGVLAASSSFVAFGRASIDPRVVIWKTNHAVSNVLG